MRIMKKIILIFSLVFSVIITAGTGCPVSAANNAETLSDTGPNIEEKNTPQHVDTIHVDVQTILQDIEQMQTDITDIQSKLSICYYAITALAILLVVALILIFVMNKNMGSNLKKSTSSDGRSKKKIEAELDAMNNIITNQRAIIENLATEIRYLKSNSTSTVSTTTREAKTVTTTTPKKKEKVATPVEPAKKTSKVKKYAMFSQDATGNMSILGRSLSDSHEGAWFEVEFAEGSNSATYTINNSCKGEMLADLSMLKRFVQDLTVPGKPKDIKVQKPGTLIKDGNSWKIDTKIQIQLI